MFDFSILALSNKTRENKVKVSSDKLFTLIKSLSPAEKIQFKLYAARKKTDSNYLKLFNVIDKQKIYNEALLKKKIGKEPFVQRLDNTKSLLTESIFKCLQEYHSSDSATAILANYIQRIEISINKQLFDLAKKIITKAEKLAEENHAYYYLGIILSLKCEITCLEENLEGINNYPHGDYLKERKCAEIIKNLIDYRKLYMQITRIIKTKGEQISDKQRTVLKMLLKNPLLKEEAKALSFLAKIRCHNTLGHIFWLLNDWQNSYLHFKKTVQLMESNPAYLKSEMGVYMNIMGIVIVNISMLKKDKELISLYDKIKYFIESLPKKLRSGSIIQQYVSIQNNFINYLLQSFDFHSALKVSEKIKPSIKKHGSAQNLLVFHGNLFLIHFYLGNYHEALQELNFILNKKETGIREDIIEECKILNIIIHYELGNTEMLPYLCRATQRYFEKKGELQPALKLILIFFGKTNLRASATQEKQDAFVSFKKELIPLMPEKLFVDFDFISWLDSKIENRSMLEILRKKVNTM